MKHLKPYFFLLLYSIVFNAAAQNKLNKRFDFGTKSNENNAISITKPLVYDSALGYGFDFQSAENIQFKENFITSKKSIYFSVKLPEGNYKIDVVLGGKKCSKTTVKAESRRLMLKEITLDMNSTTVNVR